MRWHDSIACRPGGTGAPDDAGASQHLGVTELEMLYSARNIQDRARMKEQLEASLDRVDTPEDIWEQAAEIQEALTEQAQHRSASIPDLIVAATARAQPRDLALRPGLRHHRPLHRAASTLDRPTRHGLIGSHSKALQ